MAHYIVRETYTLMHFIEADNESEALAKMKERSLRDFDEIDHSVPIAEPTVTLDPDFN